MTYYGRERLSSIIFDYNVDGEMRRSLQFLTISPHEIYLEIVEVHDL